ncbi:MAG: GNAT family N-acetyltransferase, partial [Erysipelotrichaceae bacterium]
IQKATENNRYAIAQLIATGFQEGFLKMTNNLDNVVQIFNNSIQTERFWVALQEEQIIGIIASSDATKRAIKLKIQDCQKYLGLFKGSVAYIVMSREYCKKLKYPFSSAYLEFIVVDPSARQRGLASLMLSELIKSTKYSEYLLDVSDNNQAAINCYLKFGFKIIAKRKVSLAKLKGFKAKIDMRYKKIN